MSANLKPEPQIVDLVATPEPLLVDVEEAAQKLGTSPKALLKRMERDASYLKGYARDGRRIVWWRSEFDSIVRQSIFGKKPARGRARSE